MMESSDMFLAVDIGNTHTVIALWNGKEWLQEKRISSALTSSEIEQEIHSWLKNQCTKVHINGIGISSVVPAITSSISVGLEKETGIRPLLISANLDLGIKINYEDPQTLGVDRICSSVAGYTKYGGPIIVIDLGTATTYNCITSRGEFIGGVIGAGVETSMLSLSQRAAQLPLVPLELPTTALNTNTIASIQAGILYGAIDAMESMLGRLSKEMARYEEATPTVIATGGFSSLISNYSKTIHHVEPMLVLDGIRILWQRAKRITV
ncbi:MAG: type III pantothenate kinase [Bacteroidetes bacterium]|jgi:type III pantothenate kinase|nr:type III pantothenate kinase [Bacteroidota bacterium]